MGSMVLMTRSDSLRAHCCAAARNDCQDAPCAGVAAAASIDVDFGRDPQDLTHVSLHLQTPIRNAMAAAALQALDCVVFFKDAVTSG